MQSKNKYEVYKMIDLKQFLFKYRNQHEKYIFYLFKLQQSAFNNKNILRFMIKIFNMVNNNKAGITIIF